MIGIDALLQAEHLPASYSAIVHDHWRPLADRIAQWHKDAARPLVVGINGAQGSGKSTLCRFLEARLLPELGLSAVTLSLDDLYHTQVKRMEMAAQVHPLLRTRGVPGTHDVALGSAILDALRAGEDVLIPQFSKALDDRLPDGEWHHHQGKTDIVLFEGWCVGVPPQEQADLSSPINLLEAEEDPDGRWRRHVNDALAGDYADWFSRIDRLVMLKPPTFEDVFRNRMVQEQKLREAQPNAPGLMDEPAIKRFISHYERLTRHMLSILPSKADALFTLNSQQNVTAGTFHA